MGGCTWLFNWMGSVCSTGKLDGYLWSVGCDHWVYYWCITNDVNCRELRVSNKNISSLRWRIRLYILQFGTYTCICQRLVSYFRIYLYCRVKCIGSFSRVDIYFSSVFRNFIYVPGPRLGCLFL